MISRCPALADRAEDSARLALRLAAFGARLSLIPGTSAAARSSPKAHDPDGWWPCASSGSAQVIAAS